MIKVHRAGEWDPRAKKGEEVVLEFPHATTARVELTRSEGTAVLILEDKDEHEVAWFLDWRWAEEA